jgi:hypothetical protein
MNSPPEKQTAPEVGTSEAAKSDDDRQLLTTTPVGTCPPNVHAALAWAARGVPVFPCLNTPGERTHKAPYTPNGFKDATTDVETIRAWWKKWPTALVAMPTGARSGFNVIDIDRKKGKDGTKAIPDWEQRSPVISLTVNGGIHLWFESDGELRCRNDLFDGVDLKADGGYVIVPPSEGYSWLKELNGTALPSLPSDLRPKPHDIRKKSQIGTAVAFSRSAPEWIKGNGEGLYNEWPEEVERVRAALELICADDYDVWFRVAGALHQIPDDEIAQELFHEWSSTSRKYNFRETETKWRQTAGMTDVSLGTIFHLAYGDEPVFGRRKARRASQREDLPWRG